MKEYKTCNLYNFLISYYEKVDLGLWWDILSGELSSTPRVIGCDTFQVFFFLESSRPSIVCALKPYKEVLRNIDL